MTRESLAAFRRTITVDWPKHTKEAARDHLIRTAKEGHQQIMRDQAARSGIAPTFEAFANRSGNPVENVTLPGPIVYQYQYLREIIAAALRELYEASPVTSGDYRRGHSLFINGIPADAVPDSFQTGDEIMIANRVPYARRLEVGKTESGRDFLIQVPNRIYERIAGRLAGRYGNVANIFHDYADLPEAYIIKGKLPPRYWTTALTTGGFRKPVFRKRRLEGGKPVRAPAIVIQAHR